MGATISLSVPGTVCPNYIQSGYAKNSILEQEESCTAEVGRGGFGVWVEGYIWEWTMARTLLKCEGVYALIPLFFGFVQFPDYVAIGLRAN